MAKDYVAANLEAPVLDHLFPNMIEADKSASTWPYFRKQIDHPFRVDRRNPTVGFINRDEASILYGNARAFRGRSGIEIGAWRGWSTVHLVASGIAPLHVVEPLLADADWRREFEQAIRGAGGGSTTILVPETSPAAVAPSGRSGRPMVVRVHRRRPRRGGSDPGRARLRALSRNNRNGRLS